MDYGKCKAVFNAANCKKREHRQNYCDEIIHKMEAHKMIKEEKTSIRPLDDDDNMFIKYSDIFFPGLLFRFVVPLHVSLVILTQLFLSPYYLQTIPKSEKNQNDHKTMQDIKKERETGSKFTVYIF